ncbi:hypothetical protein Vi05172_g12723 [Venturia inaequalis]|nr:hypothetical protein Vi05172_g12723 [Venturia inaequalis]
MTSKLFGRGKKQSSDISSAGYQNSPAQSSEHHDPSPRYPPPEEPPQNLSRSPSQRQISGGSTISRPPIDVASSVHQGSQSHLPLRLDNERLLSENRLSYTPPLSPNPPQEKEKRGFRDRLGIGHSHRHSQEQNQGTGRTAEPGRRLSVKRKEPQSQQQLQQQQPEIYYQQAPAEGRPNYSRNSSTPQLLSTHGEEDEDLQHNYYQQPPPQQFQGPPVPAKNQEDEPAYQQQPQPPQAYYRVPTQLQRVNTDHSYRTHHTQGSTSGELRSPGTEQQYQQLQHEDQLQQEQYQAVYQQPEGAPPGYTKPTTEDNPRYSYPALGQPPIPQGVPPQHARPVSGAQQSKPDLHYPQPQQNRASLERQRPGSQGQLLASHTQQQASANPLRLQAPARGSSVDFPPSPIHPSLAPSYEHQQQGSLLPPPPPSPQPPSTVNSKESDDESMPPPPGSRGNTIRPLENKNMAAPREGGQGSGTLQPTPGFPTFGSNIVPAGSQGQPYRGGQAAVQEGGERGRDTPPPPRASEMAEDETMNYSQLQKDHKELRDKYQKVKKYYFEKESQVHQLQNTIAHQRLSQSRTSLDDSEYAARFTRLEGLIAQLSFSIRKHWKSIPGFLHHGINKDALATGKQEMTAVGRAFFSQWLVSNIFDTYFHPDLELGLSKDLKNIWHNIRRFCPPFQSTEEEEALTSKMINWRLTTLEGLQDKLRGPDAQGHRERLTQMMNEKLMADIGLHLVDPPPADLQGGVIMILDLAVNVASHIPLESREVIIEYFTPLSPIQAEIMKIETGIPALVNPIVVSDISPSSIAGAEADRASLKSTGTRDSTDVTDDATGGRDEKKGRGMFGGLMGGGGNKATKPVPGPAAPSAKVVQPGRETPKDKEERVRISTGLAVQIRGRSVLVKAPVYSL